MVELTAEEELAAGVAAAALSSTPELATPAASATPAEPATTPALPATPAEPTPPPPPSPQQPAAERLLDEAAAPQLAGVDKLAAGIERLTRSVEALASAQAAQHRRVNLLAGLRYIQEWPPRFASHGVNISSSEEVVYPSLASCRHVIHAALRGVGYTLPAPSRKHVRATPTPLPSPCGMPPPLAIEYMEDVLFSATGLTLRLEEREKDGTRVVRPS